MSHTPPSPDENVVLRQVQGMRREIHEVLDRQARVIELMNRLGERTERLGERMERGFDDVRRELREVRSDLVLMENRVLTAQSDILRVVVRLDDAADPDPDVGATI